MPRAEDESFEEPAPNVEPEEVEEVPRADGGNPALELDIPLDRRSFNTAIVESEQRVVSRIDTICHSFNVILKEGLGEVPQKYEVALQDFVENVRGNLPPITTSTTSRSQSSSIVVSIGKRHPIFLVMCAVF